MSLPEFVKVRRGGIVLEVNRGEAPRYVRLGYALVEEKPDAPQVDPEPVVPVIPEPSIEPVAPSLIEENAERQIKDKPEVAPSKPKKGGTK